MSSVCGEGKPMWGGSLGHAADRTRLLQEHRWEANETESGAPTRWRPCTFVDVANTLIACRVPNQRPWGHVLSLLCPGTRLISDHRPARLGKDSIQGYTPRLGVRYAEAHGLQNGFDCEVEESDRDCIEATSVDFDNDRRSIRNLTSPRPSEAFISFCRPSSLRQHMEANLSLSSGRPAAANKVIFSSARLPIDVRVVLFDNLSSGEKANGVAILAYTFHLEKVKPGRSHPRMHANMTDSSWHRYIGATHDVLRYRSARTHRSSCCRGCFRVSVNTSLVRVQVESHVPCSGVLGDTFTVEI